MGYRVEFREKKFTTRECVNNSSEDNLKHYFTVVYSVLLLLNVYEVRSNHE